MRSPPRVLRILFAWLSYSSVHWAAGRWRRALVWDALLLATLLAIVYVPLWILLALMLAQIVDGAIIAPARDRSTGGYALVALVVMCVGVLVQVTLRTVWVEAFKIPSGSSIPTLLVGDHIWVDKTARHPARGDNAVFVYPRERDKDFIKRVVAVGGDTIEIRDNQLVINGSPVPRRPRRRPVRIRRLRRGSLGEAALRRVGRDARRPHLSRHLRPGRQPALDAAGDRPRRQLLLRRR